MAFHDGSLAEAPIAPAEVQGYVYDAKLRLAEIARRVWRDEGLADKLESDAAELRRRFDAAFWVEERGFYALGLDRDKRPIDSLTSNLGHLLWSGIVPEQRQEAVAGLLMGDDLWSGWGVRTMAVGEGAYNPLVYHDGTVWPHDNSLVAWGLARSGRRHDAARILQAMVEAAAHFGYRLPEVFAGFARRDTPFPESEQDLYQEDGRARCPGLRRRGRRVHHGRSARSARLAGRPLSRGGARVRPTLGRAGRGKNGRRRAPSASWTSLWHLNRAGRRCHRSSCGRFECWSTTWTNSAARAGSASNVVARTRVSSVSRRGSLSPRKIACSGPNAICAQPGPRSSVWIVNGFSRLVSWGRNRDHVTSIRA
jgi:hypothetical protein